jgi:hypothetical protein
MTKSHELKLVRRAIAKWQRRLPRIKASRGMRARSDVHKRLGALHTRLAALTEPTAYDLILERYFIPAVLAQRARTRIYGRSLVEELTSPQRVRFRVSRHAETSGAETTSPGP